MIKPSVGRVVLYREPGFNGGEDCAALVVAVQAEHSVSLAVFDANGSLHHRPSMPLLQDDDAPPETGGYARWMDYQKGQAAKTEALELQLAGKPAEQPPADNAHVAEGCEQFPEPAAPTEFSVDNSDGKE